MALSRRELLAAAGGTALLLASRRARAIGESSLFRIGQLQLGEGWNPRPSGLRRLTRELDKRTSIAVDLDPRTVRPDDPSLHETPFLYLAGDREFALPPPAQIEALRRFLTFGGFLLIDSAEGSPDGAFDGSVRQLIDAIYPSPSRGLQIVPREHVVFKSFYLLERPLGRVALSPSLEGILRDDRMQVAYIKNDLGGAWARDDFGNWEYQCEPGGERQRELAFRMGVNLVMYALCLDYKEDQVHVDFIMRRRRWRPNDGAEIPDGD